MDHNLPAVIQEKALTPSDHELMVYSTMAKQAVASKMYRGVGDEAGVMMVMLAAREMGIPPMSALNGGVNIINGKVEIAARMMSAMIRRAGHSITIKESTDTSCTLYGKRKDTNDTAEVSYTLEEAKKAGLVKPGGGWTRNPKDMCFARAISRLARQLFSDVIGVGYVEGEIRGSMEPSNHIDNQYVEDNSIEVVFDEDEVYASLVEDMDDEEAQAFPEYLDIVGKHFKWDRKTTLREMHKDSEKTKEKFKVWKSKKTA